MDISTPLIFVSLFLLAFCTLFLVYKYGIKEKSYEEALAEQRQTTNALLGVKPKPKEKKSKKAAKKLKEKTNAPGNETDESENVDVNTDTPSGKLHVEFKEEPEEVVPVKEVVEIKMKHVKKIRPILIKKDISPEKVNLDIVETPTANHFEENPPKDDFELLRLNSRDDIFKQETVKEKVVKEKKQSSDASPPPKSSKKSGKLHIISNLLLAEAPLIAEKRIEDKVVESVEIVSSANGIVGNIGKEKKKKKSEFNTRQQMSAERDGLIKLVRKAEFSKSEVQLLIDLLLNKQLEAPEVIDDWSEGKFDPVQKLKKQLAEKEKALVEEQEALLGVQSKLKEIRAEQQAEKTQLQQKIRALEESIQAKQIEYQATNNRLQVNAQKIQQLQTELNGEAVKVHKFMEENTALKMQIQQVDVKAAQIQESDSVIAKLRNDIEELSAQNQHLRMELQQSLTEIEHQQQQFMIQMDTLEKGLKQQIQQSEESRQELERNLEIALRQENDWKIEISNLNTSLQQSFEEKRRLEHITGQLEEELQVLNNEKGENLKVISQLKSELQQLKEEQATQVNGSSEETKAHKVQILNLSNELSSVKNELSSVKIELQQTETKYKTELESSDKNYSKIQAELEEQKRKNNELRTKNWKVMEALNVAESKNKASSGNKQTDINLEKITNEIRAKERNSQKEFIQRLFPDIQDLQVVASENWQEEFGKLIRNYVSDLKKQQTILPSSLESSKNVTKLEAQLEQYKNTIDETEGMLNRLQAHIQKEEINWRCQLRAKDTEIENLKENYVSPLETKILNLEKQLAEEIKLKNQMYQECHLLKSHKPQQNDATATIEKLSEEVNRLREQLRVEQTKNGDVKVCLKAQNCNNSNSTNGPALIEHCLSSSSSLASSVIEEYNKKPKNKKKKKKVPSIRNAKICSNMGCQFLYCDGSCCHGN